MASDRAVESSDTAANCNLQVTPAGRNLILDLGGLFIQVFPHRFEEWLFSRLLWLKIDLDTGRTTFEELHSNYEKGFISTHGFINGIGKLLQGSALEADIFQAWNSILGPISYPDLEWMSHLRTTRSIVLLSNTNELHKEAIDSSLGQQLGSRGLADHFDAVYFSYEMGMRKPDPDIYKRVLADQGWIPEDTIFVDDNESNLVGARAAGLQTLHHPTNLPLQIHLVSALQWFGG